MGGEEGVVGCECTSRRVAEIHTLPRITIIKQQHLYRKQTTNYRHITRMARIREHFIDADVFHSVNRKNANNGLQTTSCAAAHAQDKVNGTLGFCYQTLTSNN